MTEHRALDVLLAPHRRLHHWTACRTWHNAPTARGAHAVVQVRRAIAPLQDRRGDLVERGLSREVHHWLPRGVLHYVGDELENLVRHLELHALRAREPLLIGAVRGVHVLLKLLGQRLVNNFVPRRMQLSPPLLLVNFSLPLRGRCLVGEIVPAGDLCVQPLVTFFPTLAAPLHPLEDLFSVQRSQCLGFFPFRMDLLPLPLLLGLLRVILLSAVCRPWGIARRPDGPTGRTHGLAFNGTLCRRWCRRAFRLRPRDCARAAPFRALEFLCLLRKIQHIFLNRLEHLFVVHLDGTSAFLSVARQTGRRHHERRSLRRRWRA
mmetsp:Transcript_43164/g.119381  ORF Transcript_43164/g.119381 Transcript_43164/m.119381 type:complete len:320 (-) Transcript_43164:293-1252(-)